MELTVKLSLLVVAVTLKINIFPLYHLEFYLTVQSLNSQSSYIKKRQLIKFLQKVRAQEQFSFK